MEPSQNIISAPFQAVYLHLFLPFHATQDTAHLIQLLSGVPRVCRRTYRRISGAGEWVQLMHSHAYHQLTG